MGLYMSTLKFKEYDDWEIKSAEKELAEIWLGLNKYEKQALRNFIIKEGRKLLIEDKQKEIEELQNKLLDESE